MKITAATVSPVLERLSNADLGVLVERIGVELFTRGNYGNASLLWRVGLSLADCHVGEAQNPRRLYLGRSIPLAG